MNLAEFRERYNKLAEEIGQEGQEVKIQGTLAEGKATALSCGPGVSMVVGVGRDGEAGPGPGNETLPGRTQRREAEMGEITYCQVICGMQEPSAPQGLTAFCLVLTALTGCKPDVRRGWLERLGLFDGRLGKAGAKGLATRARGWDLSVLPYNPGKLMMSYVIKKAKTAG